ncbi:hypothetical protein RFI_23575, partial [Reticulomyxa filosa]
MKEMGMSQQLVYRLDETGYDADDADDSDYDDDEMIEKKKKKKKKRKNDNNKTTNQPLSPQKHKAQTTETIKRKCNIARMDVPMAYFDMCASLLRSKFRPLKVIDTEKKEEQTKLTEHGLEVSSLEREFEEIICQLDLHLQCHDLNRSHIFFICLWLQDMSLFPIVNAMYKKHFHGIDPPSRVCCQLELHKKCHVALEALAYKHKQLVKSVDDNPSQQRCDVLHVRSISKWAPCCIGPYSQLTRIDNTLLFAAGQIGLNPPTMLLISNPRKQMKQSIDNMNAGLQVMGGSLKHAIHHNVFVLHQPPSIVSWKYREKVKQLIGNEDNQNDLSSLKNNNP